MSRHYRLILGLLLSVGLATAREPDDLTDLQRAAVEKLLAQDAVVNKTLLHDSAYRFSDGVKGNEGYFNADGAIHHIEPPFTTRTEQDLYSLLCSQDEIVLARARGSSAYLSGSGTFIYTTTQFEVIEVIKSKSLKQPNDTIIGVVLGGEVNDAGERLRDSYNGLQTYSPGQLYLLALYRPIEGSEGIFQIPNQVSVAEPSGTLKLLTHGVTGFEVDALESQPTFAAFRAEIGKVSALKECWKPKTMID
jgi:hypothetical protein